MKYSGLWEDGRTDNLSVIGLIYSLCAKNAYKWKKFQLVTKYYFEAR